MKIWTALKQQRLLVAIFISVIFFVLIGSIYYKYSYINLSEDSPDIYDDITEDLAPVRSQVLLKLQPVANTQPKQTQYQLVLNGVGQPVTGIAVKLLPLADTKNFSFSEVEVNESVSNGPWQILINKSQLDPDLNTPSLQFALNSTDLTMSAIDPSVMLGVITLTGDDANIDLMVAEDSLVTAGGKAYDIVLDTSVL